MLLPYRSLLLVVFGGTALLGTMLPGATAAIRPATDAPTCGAPFHLTSKTVSFKITRVGALPFIAGSVNGVTGKFMFDTGSNKALALNDRLPINLGSEVTAGGGFAGGGQHFTWRKRECVRGVTLGDRVSRGQVSGIDSSDFGFVANDVGADFLGFVGFGAFSGYVLKTEYGRSQLSFFRNDKGAGQRIALRGRKILATISFATRSLRNTPIFQSQLAGSPIVAMLDTGQDGTLFLSDARRDELLRSGVLAKADLWEGQQRYRVTNLKLPNGIVVTLPALPIDSPSSPVLRVHGITEPAAITLGAQLFDQYDSVWDYEAGKLFLLKPL